MHPRSRVLAAGAALAALALAGGATACFDFDATMAGGPLSPSEAGVVDAAPPSDADGSVADTGVGQDAGGPKPEAGSGCADLRAADAGLVFCDDFDEPGSLPGPFNVEGETSGAFAVTDASSRSPPNSLDETTTPLTDGGVIDVALRANPVALPAIPATLKLAFSVSPRQIDTAPNAAIVLGAIDFLDAAGDRYTAGLAINVANAQPALALGEQTALADGGTAFLNHPLPPASPLAMNAWSDVVLAIDWTTATTATATVTVNGGQELQVPLTLSVAPTYLQVGIGTAFVTQPAPVWELLYDDVWFAER